MALSTERSWLTALSRYRKSRASHRNRKAGRPRFTVVEALEGRTLLASNWTALTNPRPRRSRRWSC